LPQGLLDEGQRGKFHAQKNLRVTKNHWDLDGLHYVEAGLDKARSEGILKESTLK